MIQIRICCGIKSKRSKTDIIQRFIVEREHFICSFYQLMNSQSCIVGLNDNLGNFWGRKYAGGAQNPIWKLLS